MGRLLLAGVIMVSVLSACSSADDGPREASDFGDYDCATHLGDADRGSIAGTLSSVKSWVQIHSIRTVGLQEVDAYRSGSQSIEAELSDVQDAGLDGDRRFEANIEVFYGEIPGILWAIENDLRVFHAIADNQTSEFSLVTLIEDVKGDLFFIGRCADTTIQKPLDAIHGDNVQSVLREYIGQTDPDRIITLITG